MLADPIKAISRSMVIVFEVREGDTQVRIFEQQFANKPNGLLDTPGRTRIADQGQLDEQLLRRPQNDGHTEALGECVFQNHHIDEQVPGLFAKNGIQFDHYVDAVVL